MMRMYIEYGRGNLSLNEKMVLSFSFSFLFLVWKKRFEDAYSFLEGEGFVL